MAEEEEEVEISLADVLSALRKPEEDTVYFTYPANGGTKTITETLEINVYTGEVFADGTEEYLSHSLQRHNLKYARSFVIQPSNAVKIQLDDSGQFTIRTSKLFLWNNTEPFQRLTVTATASTTIQVLISNNPAMEIIYT